MTKQDKRSPDDRLIGTMSLALFAVLPLLYVILLITHVTDETLLHLITAYEFFAITQFVIVQLWIRRIYVKDILKKIFKRE